MIRIHPVHLFVELMISTATTTRIFALLLAGLLGSSVVTAAEVRLKSQARCRTSVVLLGDVADVFANDEFQRDQLAGIELGPAPLAGNRKVIRIREVQDALWMRGINLSIHQFSGVEQTEVTAGGGEVAVAAPTVAPINANQRERAERFVVEAVVKALQSAAGNRDPYQVRVSLADPQCSAALSFGGRMSAQGGTAPFTGSQPFTLVDDAGKKLFDISAEVALPPGVVVVQKNLPTGTIIHISDVALKPIMAVNPGVQPFHSLEEVVGQQTTWAIPAGTILSRTGVQRPQVVRRGDAVTLYARTSGVRVRTTVRAREAGGLGDLITVESLTDRTPFFARITGVQEAEVYADPAVSIAPVPATAAAAPIAAPGQFSSAAGGLQR